MGLRATRSARPSFALPFCEDRLASNAWDVPLRSRDGGGYPPPSRDEVIARPGDALCRRGVSEGGLGPLLIPRNMDESFGNLGAVHTNSSGDVFCSRAWAAICSQRTNRSANSRHFWETNLCDCCQLLRLAFGEKPCDLFEPHDVAAQPGRVHDLLEALFPTPPSCNQAVRHPSLRLGRA